MSLPIPIRPPGRRQRRRIVAVVTAAVLAGTMLSPNADAATVKPRLDAVPFFAWGGTGAGQGTPQAENLPNGVTPIAAGQGPGFTLMLGSDAQIYSWGQDNYGQLGNGQEGYRTDPAPITLPDNAAAVSVSAGLYSGLAADANGQVYWWGKNNVTGQGPQPSPSALTLPDGDLARSVAAFGFSNTAIGTDGKLFVWGDNSFGQLGQQTPYASTTPVQLAMPGDDPVASVAIGFGFGLAVGTDGKLFSWGQNSQTGALGDGGTAPVSMPTQIELPGDIPALSVAVGNGISDDSGYGGYGMALGANGQVYAWGEGQRGSLGDGNDNDETQLSPELVPLPDSALASSIGTSGSLTSYAIGQDGTLYAWGSNAQGLIGDGSLTDSTSAKAVEIPGDAPIGSITGWTASAIALSSTTSVLQLPPQFTEASPALDTLTGTTYSAFFPATSAPTYSLVGAPSWLSITSFGAVVGTPPPGTTTFTYGVEADNAAGDAQVGPYTVNVDPAATVSGTVLDQRNGVAVSGSTVQACTTDPTDTTGTNQCQESITAADGTYSLPAPAGASVVLTAFPPIGSGATTTSTNPIAVPASGVQDEIITLNDTSTLPTGLLVGGVGTPTLNWESPAETTATGCANGIATVSVVGQVTGTGAYDEDVIPLTESPAGSGNYSGVIPPQAPVHGPVDIDDSVTCPSSGPIEPPTGPTGGGTQVLIGGSGFTGASAVTFGTTPATGFTVIDDTGIQAVAPAGTGTVTVSVQVDGQSDVIGQYTYMQVSSINPATGPQAGGTGVVITGAGLTGATEVFFGSAAAQFTQVSDTEIDAISPPGSGTQDITVQDLNGDVTATSPADQFSYAASQDAIKPKPATAPAAVKPSTTVAATTPPVTTTHSSKAVVTPQTISLPSMTQVINVLDEYVPSIPGISANIKALIESAKASITPNCNTRQAQAAGVMLAALQPAINALAASLAITIKIGLPGFLTFTGVGAPVAAGILAFIASPWGYTVMRWVTRGIVNGLALVVAKVVTAALFAAFCKDSPPPSNAYIDPSGTVLDTDGNPVDGATVTILRADNAAGPFTALDPTGPGIEPAVNPETTTSDGTFDWDVYSGWYEIQATAPGCTNPQDPTQPTVTIGPYPVPPPQVGLALTMSCASETGPPTPTVTSLGTTTGPAAGGTTLTILGNGFTPASTVNFGTTAGTAVTYLSPQTLTVTSPPGTGTVDITVANKGTTSATSTADQFLYGSPPTVTGLGTTSGTIAGGTTVTIDGTGFTNAGAVTFGSLPATSFTVESDTQIQATTPAEPAGTVEVYVGTPAGVSAQSPADQYTYTGAPATFTADTPPTSATAGQPYTYTYTASGNPTPTFSLASGSLPPGLTLNATTGALTGTPTTSGAYTFTITASNGAGPPAVSPSTTISVSSPPGPAIDQQATITGTTTVTTNLSTTTPGDLIVAFVAGDGPSGTNQKAKVTGGGLTWTLAKRTNGQSGTAEIWTARATGTLSNAAITSTLTTTGYGEALTVVAYSNAPGTGQTAGASKAKGAPTATLTTTTADSWVFAVGNDWTASIPRTVGPNQTLLSQSTDTRGDTYWVQYLNTPTPTAGATVTINDTAPTNDNWNLALIEID